MQDIPKDLPQDATIINFDLDQYQDELAEIEAVQTELIIDDFKNELELSI